MFLCVCVCVRARAGCVGGRTNQTALPIVQVQEAQHDLRNAKRDKDFLEVEQEEIRDELEGVPRTANWSVPNSPARVGHAQM